jgi:hypothetical protein
MSSSSMLSDNEDCEDSNDFTVESNFYVSTNPSSKASPLILDEFASTSSSLSSELLNIGSKKSKESNLNIDLKSLSLDFENLNDCVAALLKKSKDECGSGRDIKRRQRKNKD